MSRHDKNKSTGGGLLDSWFGRPKTKSKSSAGYGANGGSSSGAAGSAAGGDASAGYGGGGSGGYGGASAAGSARPSSHDAEQLADMQEIQNQILRLNQDEVNAKFMEILEDMNIPKDKRQPLLLKSLEEKREMLIMKGEFRDEIITLLALALILLSLLSRLPFFWVCYEHSCLLDVRRCAVLITRR